MQRFAVKIHTLCKVQILARFYNIKSADMKKKKKKPLPLYKALQNKEFFKEFTKNLPIDDKIGVQVLPNGAIIK